MYLFINVFLCYVLLCIQYVVLYNYYYNIYKTTPTGVHIQKHYPGKNQLYIVSCETLQFSLLIN